MAFDPDGDIALLWAWVVILFSQWSLVRVVSPDNLYLSGPVAKKGEKN